MRTSLILLVALSGCVWRTKQYAAPPVPAKVAPDVSYASAPAPGLSRVVIDVADGPALVENVDGASVSGSGVIGKSAATFGGSIEYSRSLCVTPCVVDTKPGVHQLRFTLVNDPARTSTGFVNLDQDPSVYRHSVGRQHSTRWKGVVGAPLVVLGLTATLTGAAYSTSSYYIGEDPNTGDELRHRDWHSGAIAGAVIGAGLTALGAWLIYGSVVEKQPGSGVQWHLGEQTATR
jgi:hypothetical protein